MVLASHGRSEETSNLLIENFQFNVIKVTRVKCKALADVNFVVAVVQARERARDDRTKKWGGVFVRVSETLSLVAKK